MSGHGIRPMQGLPPAERAVKYILDVLPQYPELSYYLGPGTEMMRLLCEAEAHRLGIEPDPAYLGLYSSRFEEEYAQKLNPEQPFFACPECGWYSGELADTSDRVCRVCGCTDDHACPGGCYWVEKDLCSVCADDPQSGTNGKGESDET